MIFLNKIIKFLLEGSPNSYRYQRAWAKRYLKSNDNKYSDHWGLVDSYNHLLGDYKKISNDLMNFPNCNTIQVIEIGSLDGKWSVELAKYFHKVHCVDLTNTLSLLLRNKLKDKMGIFYKTKGNELYGFSSDSVDLIFSMDSLVRCPKNDINKYFIEFYRVLKFNGSIMLHLPCNEKLRSVSKGFTSITCLEIKNMLELLYFRDIKYDLKTLEHGVIVTAFK
jgi:ubiquinone/menaquinone biosynthesis C-methylase UbiE